MTIRTASTDRPPDTAGAALTDTIAGPRGRHAGAAAAALALTEREDDFLTTLAEHRVLTVSQLATVWGLTPRGAARIVNQMAAQNLVERAGNAVLLTDWGVAVARKLYCWVAPPSAALRDAVLAARHGHDHPRLRAAEFYARLVAYTVRTPGADLLDWWTPERLVAWDSAETKRHGLNLPRMRWRADTRVVWGEGELDEFTLVFDAADSDLARRRRPLARRVAAARADAEEWYLGCGWVLVACTSPAAEEALRHSLELGLVPVATAVLTGSYCPADAVWLPLDGTSRLRLADLQAFKAAHRQDWPELATGA